MLLTACNPEPNKNSDQGNTGKRGNFRQSLVNLRVQGFRNISRPTSVFFSPLFGPATRRFPPSMAASHNPSLKKNDASSAIIRLESSGMNCGLHNPIGTILTMTPKQFNLRRICILAGEDFDPDSDEQVVTVLKRKFNIHLPQRRNLLESLSQTNSDHEIIELLLRYRGAA